MGEIIIYAFLAALYPTLIAATTVMLLLPRPEKLMLGFWLGAMLTSVTCGLVIVFVLGGSKAATTTRHTLSPALDLVIAAALLLAALMVAKGGKRRAREKPTPKWQQRLADGNPWHTFVVGILLSFPGVWYLAALDRLTKLEYSTVGEILVVVGFCIAQLALIEIPMLAFTIWPDQTPRVIAKAKAAASRHGRQWGTWGLVAVAGLLAIRGVIGLLR